MEQSHPAEDCVEVVCPTCRATLHPRRDLIGKRVRCPDCGVPVRVVEQSPEAARAAQRSEAGNEYRLSEDDAPVEQPRLVKVRCGTCHALLYPRAELIGKHVRCPDCFKPVLVVEPPPEPVAKFDKPAGEYTLDAEPPTSQFAGLISTEPREAPGLEPEPLPPPAPTLWYMEGIFNFPWQQETISHWMTLTLFSAFANGVTAYGLGIMAAMAEAGGSPFASFGVAMKMAFTIALGAISWLLMICYASGCVVAIIRETASGNDEVSDWHDAEFPDALGSALAVVFPMAGAGAIGFGVYLGLLPLLAGEGGTSSVATMIGTLTAVALYPIMLLSVLESGAFWVVVSWSALRLILGFLPGWLLVNAEMAAITGAWWLFTWTGAQFLPIVTAIIGAPLYAAAIMIDARLLGRFLYRANEVVSAHDEDDDDEEADEDDE
jgi:DNA-directed RNA polymerase subunit RPC12/RpoP